MGGKIETKSWAGPFLVLAGLWAINLVIVVFGAPLLIVLKIKEWRYNRSERAAMKHKSKTSDLSPCQS